MHYDLNQSKEEWNGHMIQKSRNRRLTGRPTFMYSLPHLCDSQEYLHQTDLKEIGEFYSTKFQEFAEKNMDKNHPVTQLKP